jgi:hypothetical protein
LEVSDHCPLATCPTAPGIQVEGCPVFQWQVLLSASLLGLRLMIMTLDT